ncbi:hypothetical protein B0J11DRAFT_500404 [Dendryphion nanum]|uniref:Uncharacterized protein n=1 Tax=Dendryphion nanum TaxID=256645 RepID=A0A9P9EIA0_9PLEO|nr:hypothetical protein B0J11DRAFT_500404 [Dendryphion nanum]
MLTSLFLPTLALFTPLIHAHGKVVSVRGNVGGNGTALGIIGNIVPGTGSNDITEVDTTVFKKTDISTDGLGKTTRGGENRIEGLWLANGLSGGKLPQVSAKGGSIEGVFHIVTTDGAGPVRAIIDPGATGAFSNGIEANVTLDVPGNKGNIKPNGVVPRDLGFWSLTKRAGAKNVNLDFPMKIQIPEGTACNGSVGGQENVCFLKIANSNKAGPFGGVVAFQIVNGTGNNGTITKIEKPVAKLFNA